MKTNYKRQFFSSAIMGMILFLGVSNIISCNGNLLYKPTEENTTTIPEYVNISFSTDLPSFDRKAVPNADAYSNMVYRLTGIDEQSDNEQVLGLWGSLRQLQNASIKVHTGPWTFMLTTYTHWDSEASIENNLRYKVLQGTIEITLQQATTLQFTLKEIEDCQVNGSFNYILNYSSSENWSVSAKVLKADDFSETNYSLSCETYSDNTRITCESIPSGNYLLRIQFVYTIGEDSFESYTMPLIQIAAGLTTTGSKNLSADELTRFYNISYRNLQDGTLPNGYVTTYTPYKSVVLKNPTRNNFKFLGWFYDQACTEEGELPKNEEGFYILNLNHDLTGTANVYAKWLRISYEQDGFEWHLSDDGVLTISGEGEMPFYAYDFPEWRNARSVVIEEGVTGFNTDGHDWNGADYSGFSSCHSDYTQNIKTISLPSTLTSISDSCFENCMSLETINIPEGVTSIAADAFRGCTSIQSIIIPSSVISLNRNAFRGWTESQTISLDWNSDDETERTINTSDSSYIDAPNAHYKDGIVPWFSWVLNTEGVLTIRGKGEVPFYSYDYPDWTNATSVVVEEGVTGFYSDGEHRAGFGNYERQYTQNVKTISLPNSLLSIPRDCFWGCSALEEINIPSSVTTIGSYVFEGCSKLTSITIPASVTSLCMNDFKGWTADQAILLDWNSNDSTERTVNTDDFGNRDVINAHYKDGKYAWTLWTRTYYEQDGFSWNLNVDGVLTISGEGEMPFYAYGFPEWKNATSVVVEEGITGFNTAGYGWNGANYAGFSSCYSDYTQNIKTVSLPNTLTSISDSCFEACTSLETINIPDSVTSIAAEAFYGCSSLKNLVLSSNLTYIGENAFKNCTAIASITIPSSVTTFYRTAFNGWTDSQAITFDWASDDDTERTIYNLGSYTVGTNAYCNDSKAGWFSWTLNDEGVLRIRGNGVLPFYSSYSEWKDAKSAIVEEGITGFSGGSYSGFSSENYHNTQNIRSISLPNTLLSISDSCFEACIALEEITIPDSVTTIEPSVFYGCTNLKTVRLPENLTSIESYLFTNCTALENINIPDGITTIKEYAFQNCTSLESITIPESVITLDRSAFSGWTDEQEITLDWSSSDLTERNIYNNNWYTTGTSAKNNDGKAAWFSWLLSDDGVLRIRGTGVVPFTSSRDWINATSIVVEEGVTGFYEDSYAGFSNVNVERTKNVRSVQLPSTMIVIPRYCFYGCTSLEKINIPDSVTSIGQQAFQGCTALESITIPESVTSIGAYAFYECSGLTAFTIPSSVTTIGDYALAYCTGISSITVPATVTNQFNRNVFLGWRSNQTITLDWNSNDSTHAMPYIDTWWNGSSYCQSNWGTHAKYRNGVYAWNGNTFNADGTTIIVSGEGQHYAYNNAGMDLEKVTSIVVQEGITSFVCGDIPENNTTVKTVSLPSTLTSLGDSVFEGFAGIEQIEIPSTVTSIARDAFRGCSSLKSITIPDGISSIRECTFDGCTSLDEVNLPGSIESIYEYAFQDCTSLEGIELPAAITSIDRYAFYGSGIKEIELPAALTSLGSYTFKNSSIESINFNGASVAIPEECFAGCSSLQTVTGTIGITSIGKNAFREGSSLSTLLLPETLTSIAEYAFYKCTGFTTLIIPSSVTEIGSSAFDYCTGSQTITLDWNASDSTERTIANDAFGYAGVNVVYKDGTTYGN